ncbi:hypothetical protein MLD38_016312 [Melastoma candidum]|nr:hypothetical protein MLD38_016312 [Melastoma candidum]
MQEAGISIGSPSRVQKLIASQSDPLLAKEILDFASRQPNFRPTNASYRIVIRKLAASEHFSLIDNMLLRLKSEGYSAPRSLFSTLIKAYAGAGFPDKVLDTFYVMLKFDYKPLPKHLNGILEALISRREYIRPAFDLFKDAHKHGVLPNTKSYNLLMDAFCSNGNLSVAYSLFNYMFKRDVVPNVESYRILMQGLCRRSQVGTAVNLLEDMLNKGYVPDRLSYTTLLNALCRKKKLKEAYKLLCRMKVKGCNPDIIHYNTVILGFCREGRADDACKVIEDMPSNGCLPDLVSYRTLVGGLCDLGLLDKADRYLVEMLSKGLSPHPSVSHGLVKGLCKVGKIDRACELLEQLLRHGETPYVDSWGVTLNLMIDESDQARVDNALNNVLKVEVTRDTRLVDAAPLLEEYLVRKSREKKKRRQQQQHGRF